MNGRIFAFITATRVKWEQDVSVLAEEEGVSLDTIRQQYSEGWRVDGATGEITYEDDGSGDYNPSSDTVRMEDSVEENGWIDRAWNSRVLHDSRNDVSPVVSCDLDNAYDLFTEVKDALEWLPGGYTDNGDGTFYAKDSYEPLDGPWYYSYALHFVWKKCTNKGWVEVPWLGVQDCLKNAGHSAYPHTPGNLYDCEACGEECFCEEGFTCVSCAEEENHGDYSRPIDQQDEL